MSGYLKRNDAGEMVDDDKALANASIILAETQLEIIKGLADSGLRYGTDFSKTKAKLEALISQLKRVNEQQASVPEMEDMDTWLDKTGAST